MSTQIGGEQYQRGKVTVGTSQVADAVIEKLKGARK